MTLSLLAAVVATKGVLRDALHGVPKRTTQSGIINWEEFYFGRQKTCNKYRVALFLFFFVRRRPKEVEEMGTKERAKGDNSFHTVVVVNVTSQEPHASQYGRQTDREGG